MKAAVLERSIGRLSCLKFFPPNPQALAEIARILCEICKDEAELNKLTDFLLANHNEWPGPAALREVAGARRGPRHFDVTTITGEHPRAIPVAFDIRTITG
jgi:hypothetical protein